MVDANTSELWSLFYRAWDEVVCPAIYVGYREVNDDPEYPPYDVAVLHCTALDKLL